MTRAVVSIFMPHPPSCVHALKRSNRLTDKCRNWFHHWSEIQEKHCMLRQIQPTGLNTLLCWEATNRRGGGANVPKKIETSELAVDERLLKALRHPLRVELVRQFTERTASPKELALKLNEDLGGVSYHTRELEAAGYIELADTAQRRGATEHFYRAIARAHIDDKEWAELPEDTRRDISCRVLQGIFGEAFSALRSDSLDARLDRHLSWRSLNLDAEAWDALIGLLHTAMHDIAELQAQSDERRSVSKEPGISAVAVLMGFERSG
jgi:hypothetical protein